MQNWSTNKTVLIQQPGLGVKMSDNKNTYYATNSLNCFCIAIKKSSFEDALLKWCQE